MPQQHFQRLSNLKGCTLYLDDVVVYSDTWVSHLERIRGLFRHLTEARLTINLVKCVWEGNGDIPGVGGWAGYSLPYTGENLSCWTVSHINHEEGTDAFSGSGGQ